MSTNYNYKLYENKKSFAKTGKNKINLEATRQLPDNFYKYCRSKFYRYIYKRKTTHML